MPWPYYGRQLCTGCMGISIPERNGFMIMINTLDEKLCHDWEFEDNVLRPEEVCRAYVRGFQFYEYLEPNKCRLTVYAHMDPNAPSIPDAIINMASKRVIYYGQQNLMKGEIFETPQMREQILQNYE